ncbi:MAG: hypothetical protein DRP93_05870, partial [Candidatus Neomarinimicrobiota bacterium]
GGDYKPSSYQALAINISELVSANDVAGLLELLDKLPKCEPVFSPYVEFLINSCDTGNYGVTISSFVLGKLEGMRLTTLQRASIELATDSKASEPLYPTQTLIEVLELIQEDNINELIKLYKILPKQQQANNDLADYLNLPHSTELSKVNLADPQSLIGTPLADEYWRLNNLYKIVDKKGELVIMVMNNAQVYVMDRLHRDGSKGNRLVILKSRQRGITTQRLINSLDKAMTTPNTKIGLQSFDLKSANAMAEKCRRAYNELPAAIRPKLVVDNNSELAFDNGSSIIIANTFRSQTLGSLHISEIGKISLDKMKAAEMTSGSFGAVSPTGDITLESTSEGGGDNLFFRLWEATKDEHSGWDGIFIGWLGIVENDKLLPNTADGDCFKKYDIDNPPALDKPLKDMLINLQKTLDITIEEEQIAWCISQYELLGKDIHSMLREYPATAEQAWSNSSEGLIFHQALTNNSHIDGKHSPHLPVYAVADIGISDQFAIILFQINLDAEVIILDHYADDSKTLEHYMSWIRCHEYPVTRLYLPHDSMKRELSTNTTIVYQARQLLKVDGISVEVLRRTQGLWNSISYARQLFPFVHFDMTRCSTLVTYLKAYRKKFVNGYYQDIAEHTPKISDSADAYRYLADAYRQHIT